jgi:hypothetical protein
MRVKRSGKQRYFQNYGFLPGDMQKAFFKVLRFAAHWPAAQGKVSLFLYPALTSQHGARTAPRWLDVLGYYLPPLPGLVFRWLECHGADFHLLGLSTLMRLTLHPNGRLTRTLSYTPVGVPCCKVSDIRLPLIQTNSGAGCHE